MSTTAPLLLAAPLPAAAAPWSLIFTLVGLAALLTVVGLVVLLRSRRSGGNR